MYKEILELIKSKKNVLLVDYNKNEISSRILQMILSGNSLSHVTILETKKNISFIKRNLKVDDSVEFLTYTNHRELFSIINTLNSVPTQLLLSCHYTNINIKSILVKKSFDVVISFFGKEDYEIVQIKDNVFANV